MDENFLAEIITEIFEERTTIHCSFGNLHFKHFGQIESRKIFLKRDSFEREAVSKGIEAEAEALKRIMGDNLWSEEDEKLIQEREKFIEKLREGLSKIKLPSKKEEHKKLIDFEEEKIKEKKKERIELLGLTAERFAEKKINNLFYDSITFLDSRLTKPAIEAFGYNEVEKELEMRSAQTKFFEKFNDTNISHAVLGNFYSPYFPFSEDIMAIFGRPLKDLTTFQLRMASYGKTFLNIFKNSQKKIPDYVAKDPELLLDWADSANNSDKTGPKHQNEDNSQALFGATKEDIEKIKKEDENAITLNEALKEKGGSLNMQQLMEMHGV